ncbi:hypothetical protein N7493_010716 [Penicillium malachiteum]|uniref:Uncharacterized protein n=1 Tax=Penicillium malachiteum TaxID=1324776 RepID=A0AAD6HDC9_9EURO|nr:hypothetical protein N7493_010716 [Penicillium malachiteum]
MFDLIIELYKACDGRWNQFREIGIEQRDLDHWLEFAGMFLSSLGNYFSYGNRKVIPNLSEEVLCQMASISPEAIAKFEEVLDLMMAPQPSRFGYPSKISQCGFYPETKDITKAEVEAITKLMETKEISPENTRLRKLEHSPFEILQASAEKDIPRYLGEINIDEQRTAKVLLSRGDHNSEMKKIYTELSEVRKYADTEEQKSALSQLIESFRTGNYGRFNSAHKAWVRDKSPKIEHCMGFLFEYRDQNGARADWLAVAGIANPQDTSKMKRVIEKSAEIICTLPWAVPGENNCKGLFEPYGADVPDFAIIHGHYTTKKFKA